MKNLKIKNKTKTIYIVEIENNIIGTLPGRVLFNYVEQVFYEQSVSEEEYEKLLDRIRDYARELLYKQLSRQERCLHDCREFLRQKQFCYEIREELLNIAISKNFINDARFCDLYVNSMVLRNKSEQWIRQNLMLKKIDPQIVDKTIRDVMSGEVKNEILQEEVAKALRRYDRFDYYKKKEKVIASLYRKGFRFDEISGELERQIKGEGVSH